MLCSLGRAPFRSRRGSFERSRGLCSQCLHAACCMCACWLHLAGCTLHARFILHVCLSGFSGIIVKANASVFLACMICAAAYFMCVLRVVYRMLISHVAHHMLQAACCMSHAAMLHAECGPLSNGAALQLWGHMPRLNFRTRGPAGDWEFVT